MAVSKAETQKKLEEETYQKLSSPFPKEAYSEDKSRGPGLVLTSLKAQYIKERLNEALGIMNWEFISDTSHDSEGAVAHGKLTIHVGDKTRSVTAPGFSKAKRMLGDTLKSAETDSLSKCASYIGVGNDVFKGQVDVRTYVEPPPATQKYSAKNEVHKMLVRNAIKKLGIENQWVVQNKELLMKRLEGKAISEIEAVIRGVYDAH